MAIKGNDMRIRCSFCGKTEDQVHKLIAGPDGAYICDECVEICSEIIQEEMEEEYAQVRFFIQCVVKLLALALNLTHK